MAFSDIPEVLEQHLEETNIEIDAAYSLLNFFNSPLLVAIEQAFQTAHQPNHCWLLWKVVNSAMTKVARDREEYLKERLQKEESDAGEA